ncbi:hypothetical protein GMLC_26100 [Geomonas limicola]|uniref:Uncharacterized protein n=1 Tax=Geomonas limicola TaxID=2740186 RepID=A0A6V8N929_9BACT|nr:hypothetical protein GMLC_26100 [Geomonas limicola]
MLKAKTVVTSLKIRSPLMRLSAGPGGAVVWVAGKVCSVSGWEAGIFGPAAGYDPGTEPDVDTSVVST